MAVEQSDPQPPIVGGGLIDALTASDWVDVGIRAGVIVAIFVVAAIATRAARRAVQRYVSRATARSMARFADAPGRTRIELRARTLGGVMGDVTSVVIWVVAIFAALGQFGLDLGPFLAGAGIVGVAIGFGAQSLVRDFFSGFFILLEDQFGVGDVVSITQEVSGQVEDISLRVTRLRSLDGTVWFVPNGEIRYLGNRSKEWSRALVDFPVALGTDIDAAMAAIREASATLRADEDLAPKILEDVEILGVEQMAGDTGITIRCYIKTLPLEQWAVSRRFRQEVKRVFDARDIGLAVPYRRIISDGDDTRARTPKRVRKQTGR